MPEPLPTVDIDGVEILAAGGPVHGWGSPPEGDVWLPEQLREMAAAAAELGDEIKAPAKIGHKGGDPAVGWLENIRVNDSGDRLLADIKRVPKGLSSLIEAGAYRTRSVELRSFTSQRSGKKYDWVVSGLAWLGGKMPAVRTLGDVVKLYDADDDHGRKFVEIKETDAQVDDLRDGVADLGLELVKVYADAATARNRTASDSRPMSATYTDEQRRKFAETAGIEPDKITDEMLVAAAATLEVKPEPARDLETDDRFRALEAQAKEADERSRKLETELATEKRRSFVEGVLKDRKAEPGARAEIEKMYDASPEAAINFFAAVKPIAELREYGTDEDGSDVSEEETEKRDLSEREQIARSYGLELEEVA